MKKTILPYILVACVFAVFTSCEHKPLYVLDDSPRNVHVTYDWKNLLPGEKMPDGMTLVFVGDSDNVHKYDLVPDPDYSMHTTLVPDNYEVVTWSNDASDMEVTPSDNPDDVIITQTDPNVEVPNVFYSDQEETVGLLDEETTQQVVITPDRVNCLYNVRVLGTDVVPGIITWKSTLSGLTNAVYLKNGKSAPNATPQTFTFYLDEEPGNVRSHVLSTLGKYPSKPNILILYLTDANGESIYYKFDVTNQITSAPDPKNLTVEVDLRGAKPADPSDIFDGGDGYMTPSVDNFENAETTIVM